MLRTVIHQKYAAATAADDSGFSNNGIPVDVVPSNPGFAFTQASSEINVLPSPSLDTLSSIRAFVSFTFTSSYIGQNAPAFPIRFNLMEGSGSFILSINSDLSITGAIYDANGALNGATSAPGVVTQGVPHVATLACDGVNVVNLSLDGNTIAEAYDVNGPVPGIAPPGVVIGQLSWPSSPGPIGVQTKLEAVIFEVLLQKDDPQASLESLLDPCCFDRKALNQWLDRVAAKGVTQAQLINAATTLQAVLTEIVVAARANAKASTIAEQAIANAATQALLRRDGAGIQAACAQARQLVDANVSAATRAELAEKVQSALAGFDLSWPDWCQLMRIFCLDLCGGNEKED